MHADMVDLELSSDLIGKQCCVDDLNCLIIRVGRFLLYRGYYVQYTSYWTYIVIGTMAFCPHHGGFVIGESVVRGSTVAIHTGVRIYIQLEY